MGIIANNLQYKDNESAKQYADVKLEEHNADSEAHSDLRARVEEALQGSGFEKLASKDKAHGYAGLDADGKISASAVPAIGGNNIGANTVTEEKLSVSLAQKINQKLDSAEGKVLSDNNYDDAAKALVGGIGDLSRTVQNLETNKVSHANLSIHTENSNIHVTTAEKQVWNQKLDPTHKNVAGGVAGLDASGLIANSVISSSIARTANLKQANWAQTVTTALDYIKNKPEFIHDLGEVASLIGDFADSLTETGIYRYSHDGESVILLVIYHLGLDVISQFIFMPPESNPSYPFPNSGFPVQMRTTNIPTENEPRAFNDWQTFALKSDIVQADWNETNLSAYTYIKNKPVIPTQGVTATAITRIEVVDQYPVTEVSGVLYLKRATS